MTTFPSADLTGLFAKALAPPTPTIAQGTLLSFNPADGSNTVLVGGSFDAASGTTNGGVVLTDLPFLENGAAVNYQVGDLLLVQSFNSTRFIIGRVVSPGSPRFAAASVQTVSGNTLFAAFATLNNIPQGLIPTPGISIPTWANFATVLAVATLQLHNSTASQVSFMGVAATINGDIAVTGAGVTTNASLQANSYGSVTASAIRSNAVTPGGHIQVGGTLLTSVVVAADSVNTLNVDYTIIFTRTD